MTEKEQDVRTARALLGILNEKAASNCEPTSLGYFIEGYEDSDMVIPRFAAAGIVSVHTRPGAFYIDNSVKTIAKLRHVASGGDLLSLPEEVVSLKFVNADGEVVESFVDVDPPAVFVYNGETPVGILALPQEQDEFFDFVSKEDLGEFFPETKGDLHNLYVSIVLKFEWNKHVYTHRDFTLVRKYIEAYVRK